MDDTVGDRTMDDTVGDRNDDSLDEEDFDLGEDIDEIDDDYVDPLDRMMQDAAATRMQAVRRGQKARRTAKTRASEAESHPLALLEVGGVVAVPVPGRSTHAAVAGTAPAAMMASAATSTPRGMTPA